MTDRVVKAILLGDGAQLDKTLEKSALNAEVAGKNIEKSSASASEGMGASLLKAVPGGEKLGGMLEKLKNPYVALATAAVVVGVAVGAASIDMANKYDDATAKMAATSGLSIDQANKVGDAFLTTAGQSTFSAQKMMEAYGPVSAQLGLVNGSALTASQALGVMNAATTLAEATGGDLNATTATLAKTMQAFQIPVKDAASASDTLFNASRVTGLSIDDYGTAVAKLHAKMGDLGGSLPQISTMFVDLANHGVTGKTAITAMTSATNTLLSSTDKNQAAVDKAKASYDKAEAALTKLKDSHKATAAQIDAAQKVVDAASASMGNLEKGAGAMGLTVYNAQGQFVGMQSIISQLQPKLKGMTDEQRRSAENAIFGAGAFDKLDSTIMAGNAGWDQASAAVQKHGTTQDAAAKATSTLSASFEKIKAAVVDVGIQLGQKLLPILAKVMDWVSQGVVWFAQKLPGALNTTGQVLSVVFAVIGKAISIAAPIVVTAVQAIITSWQVAFTIISTVIGAIIAVVKAIEPPIQAVVTVIVDVFSVAFKVISTVVGTEIGIVVAVIKGIVSVVSGVVGGVIGLFQGVAKGIGDIWNGVVNGIKGVFNGLGKILKDIVNTPIGLINGIIDFINRTIQIHIPAVGVGPVHTPSFDWNGLNLGHIPTLDTPGGSLVSGPTLAALSQNSVPEVVMPLPDYLASGRGRGVTIEQQFILNGNDTELLQKVQTIVEMNNEQLAKAVDQRNQAA